MLWARPMPDSSMPPHQTGMPLIPAHIVHRSRFAVSADAAQLDIDNAARADLDGLARIVRRMNGLIEADRSSDLALKLGMVDHIFVVQRLLEHHHLEFIHPSEEVDIVERVCGIGIAHQQNLGKGGSHLPHHLHVPARLDLDFDAAVTVRSTSF